MKYVHKTMLASTILSGALLLGACNDDNNNDQAEENVLKTDVIKPNTQDQKSADSASEDKFTFNEFYLTVETEENEEAITAEYKGDSSVVVYKNMQQGVNTEGDEALDLLEPIFNDLNLTPDTAEEEVINKVKELFDIQDERVIKLDVQFTEEGETKTYNQDSA